MNEDKSLEPNESIELIQRFIEKNKDDMKGQSFYFLLWGSLVAFSCLGHYIMIQFLEMNRSYLIWPVVMGIGVIATLWYVFKFERSKKIESHSDGFLKHLWMVVGISFIPAVLISLLQGQSPVANALLLAGIGTLITGLTLRFRPLTIGGLIFLASAVYASFLSNEDGLLLNAVALVFGYIIPALLLKKK